MTRPIKPGNPTFVAARKALQLHSQRQFAEAFEAKARECGLCLAVSVRQVRRWESATPPRPTPDYQLVLEELFQRPLNELGFRMEAAPEPDQDEMDDVADDIIHGLQQHDVPGWWRATPHGGTTGVRFERLVTIECAAISIRDYTAGLVPGLLQTFEYACAVLRAYCPAVSEEEIIRRADLRMKRQRELEARRNGARSFWCILDESALYSPVGGPGVLHAQLAQLLVTLTRRPDITVQVLPRDVGAHPGMAGMFTVYDLGGRRVVACEGLTGDSWTCRPSCLAAYSLAYDRLQAEALGAEASIARIAQRLVEVETAWSVGSRNGEPAATAVETTASRLHPWDTPSE
ncbi:Scr1 family TA system antitoxin-like transcriptional regulator [Embleya sp. MST-111070]|uniref:Scr1 family TA system antitoxin-like transcriptional regulator n=1 Tax=Embleya sp. MST-111070 TaxID=3398231 RepID=UPI003F73A12A